MRIRTWRALGIDAYGDAQTIDTYDDTRASPRERERQAHASAVAMLDDYPCSVVEAGTCWWSETEGKQGEDMSTVAVYGDAPAARAGGWIAEEATAQREPASAPQSN